MSTDDSPWTVEDFQAIIESEDAYDAAEILFARLAGAERQVAAIRAAIESLENETWEGPQNDEERGYNAGLRHAAVLVGAALGVTPTGPERDAFPNGRVTCVQCGAQRLGIHRSDCPLHQPAESVPAGSVAPTEPPAPTEQPASMRRVVDIDDEDEPGTKSQALLEAADAIAAWLKDWHAEQRPEMERPYPVPDARAWLRARAGAVPVDEPPAEEQK